MAKKTKKQKRAKKLKAKKQKQQIFQDNRVRIDELGLKIKMPNKEQRKEYISALIADFDNMIGV
jgi:hypothetical protein